MANLSFTESNLVRDFFIDGGYVLDFSNRTFQEFMADSIGIDIYLDKYTGYSGSKGSRLAEFVKLESDTIVGKVLGDLSAYWEENAAQNGYGSFARTDAKQKQHERLIRLSERLKGSGMADEIEEVFNDLGDEATFKKIAVEIKASIQNNNPEAALDRLHTFMVSFLRLLSDRHKLGYEKDTTLNALYGRYIKYIDERGLVKTEMTRRILKYGTNLLEAFNTIRNNHSMAHANEVLDYNESLLIFNNVANAIIFIYKVEQKMRELESTPTDDLPF